MPDSISIPGYEVVDKLGAGSAGAVYKARQISMDRMVAIKILPGTLASDARFIERFYSEARAVAKLNHPNIVTGIDVGEANGHYYFVMEYVDGDTLAHRLKNGTALDEDEALEITRQIAQALDHAYKSGIIHRDIKPANILMMQNGTAKLADLGVAKQSGGDAGGTGGRVFGTPYYMSPEQARAEIDIDIRSDIYSLGATLYHLLSGQPPFNGNPPAVVMAKQIAEEPEDVREINASVSRVAADLVKSMMAKAPGDRPETPADVVEAIKRAQRGKGTQGKRREPVANAKPGQTGKARRVAAEREAAPAPAHSPLALVVGIGGVVLLVIGIVAISSGGDGGEDPSLRAPTVPVVPRVEVAASLAPAAAPATGGAPPAPAPAPADREQQARDAFAALKKQDIYSPQELKALRELIELYEGTAAATEAVERAAQLEEQIKTMEENRLIRSEIAEVRAKALELVAQGDVAGAFLLFKDTGASGPKASALQDALREVRAAVDVEFVKVATEAKALLDAGKFDDARARMMSFKVGGDAGLQAKVDLGVKVIDDAEAKQLQQAEEKLLAGARGLYGALCTKVDEQLAAFLPEEAGRLLAEAGRDPALKPVAAFIEEDKLAVMMYEEAIAAALRGAVKLTGASHTFKMRDGSETNGKVRSVTETAIEIESRMRGMGAGAMVMRVDISKLAPDEIVSLALGAMDRGDAKTFLRLAVLSAASGKADAAREYVAEAKKLGGDVAAIERRWFPKVEAPATTAQPAAAEPAAAPDERPVTPVVAAKPSAKLAGELKRIQALAADEYQFYQRTKRWWDIVELYVKLEKHKEAVGVLTQMSRSSDMGKLPYSWWNFTPEQIAACGYYELEFAALFTYLGESARVPRLVEAHQTKLKAALASADPTLIPLPRLVNQIAALKKWIETYPATKAKADALSAELAAAPDGEKQWNLACLYAPDREQADLPVRWFSAIFELIEKFPEHPRVKSGQAMWALRHAYQHYHFWEDAGALTEAMVKLYPEYAPIKSGDYLWVSAHTWAEAGVLQEQMRDKRALESYKKALESLQFLKAKFPKNVHNQPTAAGGASGVDVYIADFTTTVTRLTTDIRRW